MTATPQLSSADASIERFEKQTSRYGRNTMIIGLVLSLIGPIYIAFFSGLEITGSMVWVAFLAVAGTFECSGLSSH
ncbi:hypothetical protein [Glutamicibacter sp. M10]|uniref:hypothetical protein n=1 Tax=Glutamicibacter sp. M10 TaxID=3023076 RepID=UPI00290565FF|nr:hypothetical protein [Glutamicibacter sp. M10]